MGPRPDGHCVDHIDCNRANNRLDNLRYIPLAENNRQGAGERNGSAKLSEAQVLAIRSDGRLQREIAADYGIAQSAVSMIKSGAKWGWL